eukprot:Em0016g309a
MARNRIGHKFLKCTDYFLGKAHKSALARYNTPASQSEETLWTAAVNGNLPALRYLVEQIGLDVNQKNNDGNAPLNIAATYGKIDIVKYLIEELKCSPRCPEMVKYLVEKHRCDLSGRDEQGNTPLNVAASSGSLGILIYLIEEKECDPRCLGHWGRSLLHNACGKNGNLEMVKYLVEKHRCDLSGWDEQGNTPLNVAASSGSLGILKYLIEEKNWNLRSPGQLGRSPLHNACRKKGNLEMVKYLVEKHGCDPNTKDENGSNSVHMAALSGSIDILIYLIEEKECDPRCLGQLGRSPLHNACRKKGNLEMVKYLVEKHGCDPNTKDENGSNSVHMAALSGSIDILIYLIEEIECDPRCLGLWGRSLLHSACQNNLEMVKYLMEKTGCNLFIKDEHGSTPLDLVITWNKEPMIKYFRDKLGIPYQHIHYMLPPGSHIVKDEATGRWVPKNESVASVQWDHPVIQNELGEMIPDWCPIQKHTGDVIFVKIETGVAVDEDPRAAVARYQDALKDGYVLASFVKILIIGAAGVGKTHLLRLLFGESPPAVRQSTPVMERPVQTILTLLKENSTFEKVTDKKLYDLLGQTINARHLDGVVNKPVTEMLSPEKSHPNPRLLQVNQDRKSDSLHMHHVSEVTQQMIPYIAKFRDAPPLPDVDWLYFIDSGGQPQFHQLLPAFMHHTNLNIFVLRLCDKLSDHPTAEYYDGTGACVSSPASLLTNKEILQSCAQATQTADQDGDSRLIMVGTHRDLQCDGETIKDKNEQLLSLLTPSMKSHLTYNNEAKRELIFPLNTKEPVDVDTKVAQHLRKSILSIKRRIKPKKIPLRWLVFHQEIQSLSTKNNSDLLSFQECCQVAKRLHMEDDTAAALKFFSDLNSILYYPSILPNVVFTNPQCLLNIITEIIKYIVYNTDSALVNDPLFISARNEGIISVKLIDLMKQDIPQVFKPSMIEAHDLIALLLHLKIVSKHNSDFFMPSLLRGLDTKGIEVSLSKHPDSVEPLWIKSSNHNQKFVNEMVSCVDALKAQCRGYKVRYPIRFKTATSSASSVQIALYKYSIYNTIHGMTKSRREGVTGRASIVQLSLTPGCQLTPITYNSSA